MSHQTILDFLDIGFERKFFDSAIRNLADETNKLRINKFAYAMRELVRTEGQREKERCASVRDVGPDEHCQADGGELSRTLSRRRVAQLVDQLGRNMARAWRVRQDRQAIVRRWWSALDRLQRRTRKLREDAPNRHVLALGANAGCGEHVIINIEGDSHGVPHSVQRLRCSE
ncbi:hypothetical protein [Paraburkholderia sp. UYCP14C]|uniref:pPIWI-associating nuclease domain-containing protein n=1 Tax=Paraburkholderia sp. UYCP14C TaxID=2511130 RepID=UPI001459FC31|nr:hypothetical protein [Paraburkholderia sp. UYCP14C]